MQVFAEWLAVPTNQRWGFTARNFLSPTTMNMLYRMRDQILRQLLSQGLIESQADIPALSENAQDIGILRSVLVRLSSSFPVV